MPQSDIYAARAKLATAVRLGDTKAEAEARSALTFALAEKKVLQALALIGTPTEAQVRQLTRLLQKGGE